MAGERCTGKKVPGLFIDFSPQEIVSLNGIEQGAFIMPRYRRALLLGYPHHIVRRGHDRQPVFANHFDFRFYLGNLNEQLDVLDI